MEHASLAYPTGSFPILNIRLKLKTYSLFVCFGWGVRGGYSCSSCRGKISFAFSSPLRVLRPWSFHGHSDCFKYILGGKSKACPSNKLKFPSSPHPLFQSEAKCKAIDMKMILYSHPNKTHFPRKVLQLACFERESFWNTEMTHCIQLFRERLSDKVHSTTPKCIVGVLSSLFFKEIWNNGMRGHGQMSASAKRK